jgi:hypothetical protein
MKQGLEYHERALKYFYQLNHKDVDTIINYVKNNNGQKTHGLGADDDSLFITIERKPVYPSRKCGEEILRACCLYFNIPVALVKSPSRKREAVTVRKHFSRLAVKEFNFTLKNAGMIIGNRDHSSVIHFVNRLEDEMDIYFSIKQEHDDLFYFVKKHLQELPERDGTNNIQQESNSI